MFLFAGADNLKRLSGALLFIISVAVGIHLGSNPLTYQVKEIQFESHISTGICARQKVKGTHYWKALPIVMEIDESIPNDAKAVIIKAGQRWDSALGTKAFIFKEATLRHRPAKDGRSRIYWWKAHWPYWPRYIGLTFSYWKNSVDPEIIESDVHVNAANFSYNPLALPDLKQMDLESLMVHEFGHVLGLDHIKGTTMDANLSEGLVRRRTHLEEELAASCLYGEHSFIAAGQCYLGYGEISIRRKRSKSTDTSLVVGENSCSDSN